MKELKEKSRSLKEDNSELKRNLQFTQEEVRKLIRQIEDQDEEMKVLRKVKDEIVMLGE